MARPFLTARWANLAIVSYAVPPALLAAYLPVGPEGETLELDTRDDLVQGSREMRAFVSLVGFQFQQCRVMGVAWPGHTDFPEINLRFYVRTVGSRQRGVVFIREFVGKPLIAWVAKTIYNEPYVAADCWGKVTQDVRRVHVEYGVKWPPGRAIAGAAKTEQVFKISGNKPVARPAAGSVDHWFKEHSWGFGMKPARRAGQPARGMAYEVIHPTWGVYPVESYEVKFDFASVYGVDWGFLSGSTPVSVLLAVGSEVAVFPARSGVGVRWGVKRDERQGSSHGPR